MSKHTPGPWYAEEGNAKREGFQPGWDVWHESGIGCVARVHPGLNPDPTAEANARLIAAAPQLLGACKAAKWETETFGRVSLDTLNLIEAAIDAAEKEVER